MSFGFFPASAVALIFALGLLSPAAAQLTDPALSNMESRARRLAAIERTAARDAVTPQKAAKAAAVERQRQFNLLLLDFATSWNKLMELSGKGGWSAKEARKTRKAFERLVRCEAWIEGQKAAEEEAAEQAIRPANQAPKPAAAALKPAEPAPKP